jgi:soluble lytic murein transglycosylase-like protein
MKNFVYRYFCLAICIIGEAGLLGQTPSDLAVPASKEQITKQVNSLESMQGSIAKQRLAVQKQALQGSPGAFFVLPPPSTMGASVPGRIVADCDPLPAVEIDSLVAAAAARESLDEELLRGVIKQESAFRPCAVSPKGARGLMQLMPATAAQYGVKDAFSPSDNVAAGAKLLKELLVRYGGDLSRALGAYNAGAAKVDDIDGIPDIPETRNYIRQILSGLPVTFNKKK